MNLVFLRATSLLVLPAILFASRLTTPAAALPDPQRIREIAGWLPAHAAGIGQPIASRAAWEKVAADYPQLNEVIAQAVKAAAKPLERQRDDLFLEFSQNGNRERWQTAENPRRERIQTFALAECLENKGRFVAPLEQAIAAICAEKTWVLSAHDRSLRNFHGEAVEIDLGAAMMAGTLATTDYLLGDKLSPATRRLIHENLQRRIFTPYQSVINGKSRSYFWIHGINNWNAVCLDGVTTAALAELDSPAERAWYIAVAEKNLEYYFAGFTPDGYCVEGLGYWVYGFGNYALLAETIRQATGGHLDLLAQPPAAQPALFGARTEILNGIYPSIADCHPGNQPAPDLMYFLNRRFGWQLPAWSAPELKGELHNRVTMAFLPSDLPVIHAENNLGEIPWRTGFPQGGVFIFRPGPAAPVPFAACIKGGNNGVSHGHNDAGSFSVVAGHNMVICDPGGEVYTARTFGPRRYDSKVLNSFGHAVPVVGGQLQHDGSDAKAVILSTNFTEAADSITFDLRSAYSVAGLKKLERTFVYQRGKSAALTVTDNAAFAKPNTFESALITWGTVTRLNGNRLIIQDGDDTVGVDIDTQGQPCHIKQERIDEDVSNHRQPTRVGIVLDAKATAFQVTLKIQPAAGANEK